MTADIVPAEKDLTARQRDILRVLIREYITTATPVGSGAIQESGHLGVSSATIRNELVELEELGYLMQPHTSAGRVPTVRGYRYFVEQLMEQVDLPVPEQHMIRHQFHQIGLDLEQWMRLTAAVLAQSAQSASLVTPPRAASSRLKHMELISVNDMLCLMILVLHDSSIHQELLVMTHMIDQDTLHQASNKMNQLLHNGSVSEIETSSNPEVMELLADARHPQPGWEAQVLQRVLHLMQQSDRNTISEIYRDGLINVIRQPEFGEADKFGQVVRVLEHRGLLESILAKILNANGVQIIIGGDGTYEEIDDVSMVLSPYGIKDRASGVLGVMGPTRMPYARAISAVRYMAQLMDGLLAEMYGAWDA